MKSHHNSWHSWVVSVKIICYTVLLPINAKKIEKEAYLGVCDRFRQSIISQEYCTQAYRYV